MPSLRLNSSNGSREIGCDIRSLARCAKTKTHEAWSRSKPASPNNFLLVPSSDHNRGLDPGKSPVNITRRGAPHSWASCLSCAAAPAEPDPADHLRRATGLSQVRVVGLPWLAPSQTPQSARREDEGEAPEPAERPECPDEEEAAGGLGDLAVMCPPHVDDGHACREQPDEQHDDVPRSPFGEHQRPVQQYHENGQRNV